MVELYLHNLVTLHDRALNQSSTRIITATTSTTTATPHSITTTTTTTEESQQHAGSGLFFESTATVRKENLLFLSSVSS
jgi:hypothetical protein